MPAVIGLAEVHRHDHVADGKGQKLQKIEDQNGCAYSDGMETSTWVGYWTRLHACRRRSSPVTNRLFNAVLAHAKNPTESTAADIGQQFRDGPGSSSRLILGWSPPQAVWLTRGNWSRFYADNDAETPVLAVPPKLKQCMIHNHRFHQEP